MKKVFSEFIAHTSVLIFAAFAVLLYLGAFLLDPKNFFSSLWILLLPVLLSPFVEWVLHKYSLHRIVDPVKSPWHYAYMLNLHYKHHWEPTNLKSVFAPMSGVFTMVIFFIPVGYFVFGNVPMLLIFEASIVTYFLFYEWIHLAHHMSTYKPVTA